MGIEKLWEFVQLVLSPLDFVAIIMVYFLTQQYKEMVKKKWRRTVPAINSLLVVLAIMWAAPTTGPFARHIQFREGFIYTLVYTAMALAMRHLIKRFGKTGKEQI